MTDGVPTRNVDKTLPETKAVRDAGIALFAVGIGKELNRTELVLFVGGKEEYVYYATDFEDLVASVEKVLSSSCQMVGPSEYNCHISHRALYFMKSTDHSIQFKLCG